MAPARAVGMQPEQPVATAPSWIDPRERRVAPRVAVSLDCHALWDGARVRGRVHDLSASGASIEVQARLSLGEVIRLELDLDDGAPCTVAALVRRVGPNLRYGVEFHAVAPELRSRLAAWLAERIGRVGDPGRRRWQNEGSTCELHRSGARPRLRWQIKLPVLAREALDTLSGSDFVFVPGPADGLGPGATVDFELVLPFTHFVFQTAAEVIWVHASGEGVDGAGVSLRLAGMTRQDHEILRAVAEVLR